MAETPGVDFALLNEEDYRSLSAPGRRRAREGALLMLYQMDIGENSLETASQTLKDASIKGGQATFALELLALALEYQDTADALIQEQAQDWEFERLFSIDKAILRLSLAELQQSTTPETIIINEAVELAKKFGDDASPSFVNAVLDALRKARAGEGSSK
jgi:N utilization substance protein B